MGIGALQQGTLQQGAPEHGGLKQGPLQVEGLSRVHNSRGALENGAKNRVSFKMHLCNRQC